METNKQEKKQEKNPLTSIPLRMRMLNLISDLEPIKKIEKGHNGAIYSHYAHNDVQKAVMSLLPKHAIFMISTPEYSREQGILTMRIRFEDAYNPSDFVESSTPVIVGNQKDEKGIGSAMSYALKYSLMRIFGLGGEDDADAKSNPPIRYISKSQSTQISNLIGTDTSLKDRIFNYYKVSSLDEIQEKDFITIMKGLMVKQPKQEVQVSKKDPE